MGLPPLTPPHPPDRFRRLFNRLRLNQETGPRMRMISGKAVGNDGATKARRPARMKLGRGGVTMDPGLPSTLAMLG